jgi:hypothetical protein
MLRYSDFFTVGGAQAQVLIVQCEFQYTATLNLALPPHLEKIEVRDVSLELLDTEGKHYRLTPSQTSGQLIALQGLRFLMYNVHQVKMEEISAAEVRVLDARASAQIKHIDPHYPGKVDFPTASSTVIKI